MAKVTLFSQVLHLLPRDLIRCIIKSYGTDKHAKGFDTYSHLVSMVFGQFSDSQSLRDISNGLRSATGNLRHLGMLKAPSKSNLSYQNEHRNSEVFREIYYALFSYFGQQGLGRKLKLKLKAPIKLLDSSLITLCIDSYDWAKYTHTKGGVKIHTILDFNTLLPEYVHLTDGKGADNSIAKHLPYQAGSIVVADRAYCTTDLFNVWDSTNVYFVVRHKENLKIESLRELELPEYRHQNIVLDEIVRLTGQTTRFAYPKELRRIAIADGKGGFIELLTNIRYLAASTIAELYRNRWHIEIFFKTIKQNFYIKSFLGTSKNAIEIQIWTCLITMLLIAYLRSIAQYKWHMANLVNFLRLNTFTKIDLYWWLNKPFEPPPEYINHSPLKNKEDTFQK